ncbi:MAG TPA: NUDIX hydrolase [Paenirhodobacter sp.]
MRRFGEALVRGQAYRRRPGAYAVLVRDGAVLLTHQAAPVPEYQLPGGGIDPGEGPLAALHREAFEETGWSIAAPRHLGSYRRYTYMPDYDMWAEKLCAIYLSRPILRRGAPSEAEHKAVWVSPRAAVEMLENRGDRHFMIRALRDLGWL